MVEEGTNLVKDKINLTITTPRGIKFVDEADMIIMRCIDGDLGVLPRHEPISTVLGDGILRVYNDGVVKKLAVFGGVVEVDENSVKIFSTIAQLPDEIDLERARRDREEAEASIKEKSSEAQFQGLHALIRKSLVRIEVSLHLDEEFNNGNDKE